MDFENAAKISSSRFVILKNKLALLERALVNFMLDIHTKENGYIEHSMPVIVNSKSMFGTSQLPKFENDQYNLGDTQLVFQFLRNDRVMTDIPPRKLM